jgi:hypothetical protein
VKYLLPILILAFATAALADFETVAASAWYESMIWDNRGEEPVVLEAEDINWCRLAWTPQYADICWHYQYLDAVDMTGFQIDFDHHVFSHDDYIWTRIDLCAVWDGEAWIYITDGSPPHNYTLQINIDATRNCGMGQAEATRLSMYWLDVCSEHSEPERSECNSTDYGNPLGGDGGVGQPDKSIVADLWMHHLCPDWIWRAPSETCELLDWYVYTENDWWVASPVPTDVQPPSTVYPGCQ